ncbi:hypothetical protein SKAU_G00200130 [Synaphobranchus kaupii]|uniref:Uncharacterized protein n=1 Tax=Synaphobranchus kaupii TaxID=118154 RepID=A0A9Q1IX74_SYNKA|nr:hypothetical protein SKAU_G00200130 [Synaphobranchus kaupii]
MCPSARHCVQLGGLELQTACWEFTVHRGSFALKGGERLCDSDHGAGGLAGSRLVRTTHLLSLNARPNCHLDPGLAARLRRGHLFAQEQPFTTQPSIC